MRREARDEEERYRVLLSIKVWLLNASVDDRLSTRNDRAARSGRENRRQHKRPPVLGDAINCGHQFADDGDQRDLWAFASGSEVLVVGMQPGVVVNGGNRRHPQCAPQSGVPQRDFRRRRKSAFTAYPTDGLAE
jgi:hypothetical protein